jgi:hypothetical protein
LNNGRARRSTSCRGNAGWRVTLADWNEVGGDRGECEPTALTDGVPTTLLDPHAVRGRARDHRGPRGPNGEPHPVQTAMIEELGPQCGFCTSGQVMSAVALLKANPKPTRDEARHALAGNLCRCGAYDHYLNSVLRAAKGA